MILETIQRQWPNIMAALAVRNLPVNALMRSCKPVSMDDNLLTLDFPSELIRAKYDNPITKQLVEDAISAEVGCRVSTQCIVNTKSADTPAPHIYRKYAPRKYNPRSGKWSAADTQDKRIVYLAGPMGEGRYRQSQAAQWRIDVMGRAKNCGYIIPEMIEYEGEWHEKYGSEIPQKDFQLIARATELVAFIDHGDRIDTFCEIAVAKALGKRVTVVILEHIEIPWFVSELFDDALPADDIMEAVNALVNLCGGDSVDYHEYLMSPEWKEKAKKAKASVGYRCQVCNVEGDDGSLHAHHRTYERLGHELDSDITVLCADCHELFSKNGKLAKA